MFYQSHEKKTSSIKMFSFLGWALLFYLSHSTIKSFNLFTDCYATLLSLHPVLIICKIMQLLRIYHTGYHFILQTEHLGRSVSVRKQVELKMSQNAIGCLTLFNKINCYDASWWIQAFFDQNALDEVGLSSSIKIFMFLSWKCFIALLKHPIRFKWTVDAGKKSNPAMMASGKWKLEP